MKQHWLRVGCLMLVGFLCPLKSTAQEVDVVAIRALQARQADAWNRHDPSAYSDLFAQDGDVVNVLGW